MTETAKRPVGRPRNPDKLVQRSVALPPALWAALKARAASEGVSLAALVRRLLSA